MRPIDAKEYSDRLIWMIKYGTYQGVEDALLTALHKLAEMPTLTLDDLRPKGRWEPKERAMWLPYYNGGLDCREYRCSKCWNRTTNKQDPRWGCYSKSLSMQTEGKRERWGER